MSKLVLTGIAAIFLLAGCTDEVATSAGISDTDDTASSTGDVSTLGTGDTADKSSPGTDTGADECVAGNLAGTVFSFKADAAACAYAQYAGEYLFDDISVSGEGENTFGLQNRNAKGDDSTGCEKDGCNFVCNRYWLGGVEADGSRIDEASGATVDAWASIRYELDLWGTLNSEGVKSANATLHVSCSGELCNEDACQSDLSGTITWE